MVIDRSTMNPHNEGVQEAISGGSGLRKAAILVLALDEDSASQLLRSLSDDELKMLTTEIADLGVVEQDLLLDVLQEFQDLSELHGVLKEGGMDQAIRLVERTFDPERARGLVQLLESQSPDLRLGFLSKAETDGLLSFLDGEHPQTVAVVLAHMTPSKAAELLDRFDDDYSRDIVRRIASLQGTHEEVLERLEERLRSCLDVSDLNTSSSGQRDGLQTAAEILRASGRSGRDVLHELRSEQPDLVENLYRRLFLFDDVIRLDDRSIQRLLKEVDRRQLAIALRTANEALKNRVFENLSSRASELIIEEMNMLGPVRVGDVESARRDIVNVVLELEEAGSIYIEGRGSHEDRLVY